MPEKKIIGKKELISIIDLEIQFLKMKLSHL